MKRFAVLSAVLFMFMLPALSQDWIRTGTGVGGEKIRIAVPEFKLSSADPQSAPLDKTFNAVLFNDLSQAGIFDMVSKSFYPLGEIGVPADARLDVWAAPPPNAAMLAFGNLGVSADTLQVQGWLFDVKNAAEPTGAGQAVSGKPLPTPMPALSPIVLPTKSSFDSAAELPESPKPSSISSAAAPVTRKFGQWIMTAQRSTRSPTWAPSALSPRISPDNSRIAFTSFSKGGPSIAMWSLELGRLVKFPVVRRHYNLPRLELGRRPHRFLLLAHRRPGDLCLRPEWQQPQTPNGVSMDLTSRRFGIPRPTPRSPGSVDVPACPRSTSMDADGSNVQRLTDQGYAVSPSWSPNGQFLAFAWVRHYGPGAPGASDIYIMDVASRQWVQLTHDGGRNDFPSWSPDGRHIVYQSTRSGNRADLVHAGRRQPADPVDL